MNSLELKIINYLKSNHFGKSNSIHFIKLANIFDLNERDLRSLIADLVSDNHIPIGSGSNGYYWIDGEAERKAAHEQLLKRIKKLSKRAKGIRLSGININIEKPIEKYNQLIFS